MQKKLKKKRRQNMFLNHNISSDLATYSQFSHHYTFIACHKEFEDRFGDVANKIYITDYKDFADKSGAILIDNKRL